MPVQLISVCLGARKALDVGVANRLLPAICCSVNRTAICPDGPGCWSPPQSPASGLRHPLISTLGKPATPPPARSPPPCSKPLPQLRLVSVAAPPGFCGLFAVATRHADALSSAWQLQGHCPSLSHSCIHSTNIREHFLCGRHCSKRERRSDENKLEALTS